MNSESLCVDTTIKNNENNDTNIENEPKISFSTIKELKYIRNIIENMEKNNQIEILRILNKCKEIKLNENQYGIHVNMNEIPVDIIDELKQHINYIITQEKNMENDTTNILLDNKCSNV
jgi:hypothetical protein